jgi:predicted RNA-binding Zn-ribbon protein involved in translation (DUF1610 family)
MGWQQSLHKLYTAHTHISTTQVDDSAAGPPPGLQAMADELAAVWGALGPLLGAARLMDQPDVVAAVQVWEARVQQHQQHIMTAYGRLLLFVGSIVLQCWLQCGTACLFRNTACRSHGDNYVCMLAGVRASRLPMWHVRRSCLPCSSCTARWTTGAAHSPPAMHCRQLPWWISRRQPQLHCALCPPRQRWCRAASRWEEVAAEGKEHFLGGVP